MFGRGSPRFNMMQAASMRKKGLSPKFSEMKKASPKVCRPRANWNAGLEKALVDLLQKHNNECYRGQNGWSSEAWNRIVKLFHEMFPYVSFTKVQIQDKEKELKRDYRVLKEARKQSGAHWNEKLCRIEAEEPIWDNIIASYERAKKFRNKSFPLFEALGELYDGQTAEGTMNFTSIEPSQAAAATQRSQGATAAHATATHRSQGATAAHATATQHSQGATAAHATATYLYQAAVTQASQAATTQASQAAATLHSQGVAATQASQVAATYPSQAAVTQASTHEEEIVNDAAYFVQPGDDDDIRVLDQPPATTSTVDKRGRRAASSKSDKGENAGLKRRQDGKVVHMMARFLELKEKQAEGETEDRARTKEKVDEFSIPLCIAVVDGMEELSDDEKVDAYGVFKDAQNRAIFMTAKEATRLKWLRKEIRKTYL